MILPLKLDSKFDLGGDAIGNIVTKSGALESASAGQGRVLT